MVSKKATLLAASAMLAEQAAAFNSHRHAHQHIQKRDVTVVDMVTVWTTVTVCETDAASTAAAAATNEGANGENTITSTAIVVVPSSVSEASPKEEQPQAPAQTTLSTAVKPKEPKKSEQAEAEPEAPAPEPVTTVQVAPKKQAPKTEEAAPAATSSKSESNTENKEEKSESKNESKTSSTGGNPKRGIAYNDVGMANAVSKACGDKVKYAYSWGILRDDGLADNLNFCPTFWGLKDGLESDPLKVQGYIKDAYDAGSRVVFSLNEPERGDQANADVSTGIDLHTRYVSAVKNDGGYSDLRIGAPSISSDDSGVVWLDGFVGGCKAENGCTYDFCNIHWYGPASATDHFFSHIEKVKGICEDKPIWLTEFAATDSDPAAVKSFMEEVIPKLEQEERIEYYAYFMAGSGVNQLMADSFSLSDIGNTYCSI